MVLLLIIFFFFEKKQFFYNLAMDLLKKMLEKNPK